MNDYKELIEELKAHCGCIIYDDDCSKCEGLESEKALCSLSMQLIKRCADAIEQLVKERDELYMEVMDCTKKIGCKAIEQVKKERDAAISQICQGCDNCKHRDTTGGEPCISCSTYRVDSYYINSKWEWRGVQE